MFSSSFVVGFPTFWVRSIDSDELRDDAFVVIRRDNMYGLPPSWFGLDPSKSKIAWQGEVVGIGFYDLPGTQHMTNIIWVERSLVHTPSGMRAEQNALVRHTSV